MVVTLSVEGWSLGAKFDERLVSVSYEVVEETGSLETVVELAVASSEGYAASVLA